MQSPEMQKLAFIESCKTNVGFRGRRGHQSGVACRHPGSRDIKASCLNTFLLTGCQRYSAASGLMLSGATAIGSELAFAFGKPLRSAEPLYPARFCMCTSCAKQASEKDHGNHYPVLPWHKRRPGAVIPPSVHAWSILRKGSVKSALIMQLSIEIVK